MKGPRVQGQGFGGLDFSRLQTLEFLDDRTS